MTILDMKRKVDGINLERQSKSIIESEARNIVKRNEEQLQLGQTSEGLGIAPSYALFGYAQMKQEMNSKPPLGTPDLRLTGAFYGGFYFEIDGDSYTISSHDAKTDELAGKYGEEIFGLNENNKSEIKGQVTTKLANYVKSKLL